MKWSRLSFTLTYSPFHNGANVHRLRRSNLTQFWHLRCYFGFDKVCRVILKQHSTNVNIWSLEGQIVKIWSLGGRRVFVQASIFHNLALPASNVHICRMLLYKHSANLVKSERTPQVSKLGYIWPAQSVDVCTIMEGWVGERKAEPRSFHCESWFL